MRKLFKERKIFKGGNYMRKYGNNIHFLEKKSEFNDSGFVVAFDELVTTIEFAFIYKDVRFRALCLLFQSLFPLN